jgi:phosphatidylglycerol:prolipoprotein diacylglycerol transferase
MIALGLIAGLRLLVVSAPRAGVPADQAFDAAFWLIVAGLFASRAGYVLLRLEHFVHRPWDALKYWNGGLLFHGALLGGLAAAVVFSRRHKIPFLALGDAFAPPLALGQAVGRLGCLAVGCCYGRPAPSGWPLALTFPAGGLAPARLPLQPTQLYEAAGLTLLTIVCMQAGRRKRRRPGGILGTYLTGAGALRFGVDFLRGDFRGQLLLGWPPTTWAALLAALAGVVLLTRRPPESLGPA